MAKHKVIVTGGAGFIGSHLVDLLTKKGFKVYSLDNYATFGGKTPKERLNKLARYFSCDITDLNKLKRYFLRIRPKYVFHVAALARIQPSIKDPHKYLAVNSLGTLNVLMASKLAGAKRAIYSASSSAYGRNKIPYKETIKPDPLNPYAKTKLDGEHWMKIFAEVYGLETVSLRYFNVYGPRNTFAGPYTTVITKFLHFLSQGEPMTIVGDGRQTRDYTHVADVARANLLAALSKKVGHGEVINIGCGRSYSVRRVAEMLCGETFPKLKSKNKIKFIPPWPGEARHTLADWSRAKHLLNWHPTVKLETGIRELKQLHGLI